MSFYLILRNLHNCLLVFLGLCNDVAAYPVNYASYPVPVRQFRLLPFGLLQCMGRPKPPCHLLILQGVTLAYKGFAPSGLVLKHSFKELLLYLPFKAHTRGHKTLGVRWYAKCIARWQGSYRLISS